MRIQMLPTNIPRLVRTRNLVSCRRVTYFSSAVWIENSSFQSGSLLARRNQFIAVLPHVIDNVECDSFTLCWRHHVNLCRDLLISEEKGVGRLLTAERNLFGFYVCERLAGAYGCAHRPFANRGAVVAHIAFHHLLLGNHHLGNAKWASEHAVVAGDAAWL